MDKFIKPNQDFKKLHAINIGGWFHLHEEPFYEAKDMLNEEENPEAEKYATLCALAPDMLETLNYAKQALEHLNSYSWIRDEIENINKKLKP